ncbi:MAG: efflux transporter outer membrane subunit [Planctomycetota bacterium]
MIRPLRLFAVATVLLLSACATSAPRVTPELPFELPQAFDSTLERSDSDEPWYHEFEDDRLEALIAEAFIANPTLDAAWARLEQAQARATIAGADALPRAGFAAGAQRSRNQFFAPGFGPQVNRVTTHSLSFDVSWEIDLWGRIRAGQSAAITDAEQAAVAYDGARLSLSGQIANAYFAATTRALILELARQDYGSVRDLASTIERRFKEGLRPALDYRLALADLGNAESRRAEAFRDHEIALRQLETLLARYPEGRIAVGQDLPAPVRTVPSVLPTDLLWRRPDLVESERALAAAGARTREARRALLPRISLSGSGGTVSEDLADILDLDFSVWTIAANLSQPIFEGGRLRANVDLAASREEEQQARFVEVALRAFSEVERALATEGALARREEALANVVENTRTALEISEARYLQGVVSIVDLLQTRRSYYTARTQHLLARLERLTHRVDLHLALGGGFESPDAEGQP